MKKFFCLKKKNVYFSSIEFDENLNKEEKINKNNFTVNKILSGHDGVESIKLIQSKKKPQIFWKSLVNSGGQRLGYCRKKKL